METDKSHINEEIHKWQQLYFKLLHLGEMIENRHWDAFFASYESYTVLFNQLNFKMKTSDPLVMTLSQKIHQMHKMLIQTITTEMDASLVHLSQIKSNRISDYTNGNR